MYYACLCQYYYICILMHLESGTWERIFFPYSSSTVLEEGWEELNEFAEYISKTSEI